MRTQNLISIRKAEQQKTKKKEKLTYICSVGGCSAGGIVTPARLHATNTAGS
jgi:hypothetical protein